MKNRTMKVALIALVLVLATSCFVGGTFAKYITSSSVNDQATVAYWGFSDPATVTFNLFDMTGDTGVAADGKIAPGTTNTKTFELFNAKADDKAPEVAYRVTVDTTGSTETLNAALDEQLTWTLNGSNCDTWAEFIAAVKLLSGEADGSKDYAPNEALPAILKNGTTNTITWTWGFEDTTTPEALAAKDKADTAIGNLGELPAINLTIKITVEQIDTYTAP